MERKSKKNKVLGGLSSTTNEQNVGLKSKNHLRSSLCRSTLASSGKAELYTLTEDRSNGERKCLLFAIADRHSSAPEKPACLGLSSLSSTHSKPNTRADERASKYSGSFSKQDPVEVSEEDDDNGVRVNPDRLSTDYSIVGPASQSSVSQGFDFDSVSSKELHEGLSYAPRYDLDYYVTPEEKILEERRLEIERIKREYPPVNPHGQPHTDRFVEASRPQTTLQRRRFNCTRCRRVFTRIDRLKRHEQEIHQIEGRWACCKCLKIFVRKSALDEHSRANTCVDKNPLVSHMDGKAIQASKRSRNSPEHVSLSFFDKMESISLPLLPEGMEARMDINSPHIVNTINHLSAAVRTYAGTLSHQALAHGEARQRATQEQEQSYYNFNSLPSNPSANEVIQKEMFLAAARKIQWGNTTATLDSDKVMTTNEIWDRLQSMEKFRNGEIDIDKLCTELRAKAKYSGDGGVFVEEKHVKKILGLEDNKEGQKKSKRNSDGSTTFNYT